MTTCRFFSDDVDVDATELAQRGIDVLGKVFDVTSGCIPTNFIAGVASAFGASKATASNIQSNVAAFASANGLKGAIYGVIIMVFVLFEPLSF